MKVQTIVAVLLSFVFSTAAFASELKVDVSDVDATRIVIETETVIDKSAAGEFFPVLSRDAGRLLYVRGLASTPQEFVVFDLNARKPSLTIPLEFAGNIDGVAWSPDEKRVAYCVIMKGQKITQAFVVLDITSRNSIPLYDKCPLVDALLWPEDNELIFLRGNLLHYRPSQLNLDTLEFGRGFEQSERWKAISAKYLEAESVMTHPNAYIALVDGEGGDSVDVINRDGSFSRSLFGKVSYLHVEMAVAPNLEFAVNRQRRSRKDPEELVLLDFGVREQPVMDFRLAGESLRPESSLQEWARDRIRKVEEIYGDVYDPKINPLNGKVIGPDETKYRGRVKVTAIHSRGLELRSYYEEQVIRSGDVVKPIWLGSRTGGRHHNLMEEWTVLVGDGSLDIGPKLDDF